MLLSCENTLQTPTRKGEKRKKDREKASQALKILIGVIYPLIIATRPDKSRGQLGFKAIS